MDPTSLILSFAFGLIGMAMFIYGKKMQRLACLAAGVGLMVCPYLIPGTLAILIVGSLLTATPMVWKA